MSTQKTSPVSLWRDQSFVIFWSGRAVSLLGTAITSVALPILVYRLTASALLTSLLATAGVLPYFVFGLFAGAVADSMNRRRIMIASDLLNTLLLGSIPVAYWFHVLTLPQIFIVALLSASAFVWFDAADFGAVVSLVGRERLVAAFSALSSMDTVVAIIGPSIAGALAAIIGPAPTLSIDAFSYLLSAISLLFLRRALIQVKQERQTGQAPARQLLADIAEGLKFLWHHRLVRTLTILGFGLSFTGGAVFGLLVVYAVKALSLSTTDARIGLLFTAGALGSFGATVSLPFLTKRVPIGWITLAGMSLNLLFLLQLTWTSSFVIALIMYTCWELSYTLVITNGRAFRQIVIPDHLQSRVNAAARMVAWGGTPFGAAIGGILAQATTVRTAFLIMAIGVAVSIVVGWVSPLRERIMVDDAIRFSTPDG